MFSTPSSPSAQSVNAPPQATVQISKQWEEFIVTLQKKAKEEDSRSGAPHAESSDREAEKYIKALKAGKLELKEGVRIEPGKDGNARGVVDIGTPDVVEGVNAIVDEFKKAGITAVHIYVKSTTDVAKDQKSRMDMIRHALDQGVIPILKGINGKGAEEAGQNSLLGTLLFLYRYEKEKSHCKNYLDLVIKDDKAFEMLLKDLELDDRALKQLGEKYFEEESLSLDGFKEQLRELRETATNEKGKDTEVEQAHAKLKNILGDVAKCLAPENRAARSAKHRDTSSLLSNVATGRGVLSENPHTSSSSHCFGKRRLE